MVRLTLWLNSESFSGKASSEAFSIAFIALVYGFQYHLLVSYVMDVKMELLPGLRYPVVRVCFLT